MKKTMAAKVYNLLSLRRSDQNSLSVIQSFAHPPHNLGAKTGMNAVMLT